jgi:hypothetical protein
MAGRWIYDASRPAGQRLVEIPLDYRPVPRPRVAVHGVKAPFKSMADGLYYDDARTYERELKARGYEIVGERQPLAAEPEVPSSRDALIETFREMGVSIEGRFPNDCSDPEFAASTPIEVPDAPYFA